jgi:hypothetical protein
MVRAILPAVVLALLWSAPLSAQSDVKIPPEVTPAMRAACEADVRRLCVTPESTVQSVKQCVLANFMRLGRRCQMEIASAGLAP